MDVELINAKFSDFDQTPQFTTPEWIIISSGDGQDFPGEIEEGTPIAIRLNDGREAAVFFGDSFDVSVGDWESIVAYRLLSAKEAQNFIEANRVIKQQSVCLEAMLNQCEKIIIDLKTRFSNPLFEHMLPKLVAAFGSPEGCGHKGIAANVTQSENLVLQHTIPMLNGLNPKTDWN
ncbi:hypothetical protein [uncultured Microbulbifer sp.]|uniref:hypothetical protein n=1 Tax=uncultured Microbulbifer sp. TaxID=348147 RepID=UPI0026103A10|nr:hypothetical protein [uncultured Microbulbifer sp.]